MSWIEIIGALFGAVSVYLSVRENIWSWPTAIVNVFLYIFVFHGAKLYADMGLQVVYLVLSFYGWYQWLYGGTGRTELPVSQTPPKRAMLMLLAAALFAVVLGVTLKKSTDASLPYWDAATTSFSLLAQWMMTRKLLENWLIWIAVDVVYVGMYIKKALYPTALLYAVFLVLAVLGYRAWKKSLREGRLPALSET
ncbi:MAG TPA: nicotinamide riboside transporter PnuC [Thermoanaerobaculia bacterium]|nr:nicotinamide riboside transporter PnuC [Thermoanaerobaculia bacterium]